jgi:hypothetical protein
VSPEAESWRKVEEVFQGGAGRAGGESGRVCDSCVAG